MPIPSEYYTDAEWEEAAGRRPLEALDDEQLMLLHRHWIWANAAFRWFERELQTDDPIDAEDLACDRAFSMYLWYGLLWSVIEGLQKRRVVVRGSLLEDLRSVRDPLRDARNAVFHVSEDAYYDARLFKLMDRPNSAARVRRVHKGFARMFLEELRNRAREPGSARGPNG